MLHRLRAARFSPGEPVIYVVTKRSTRPGPRAESIHPATHGDTYQYRVKKFWRVVQILDNGRLELRTRGGKRHVRDADDLNLCRPSLLERLLFRRRFPSDDLSRA